MQQLKTYGIPALIIVAVALLVCLALWGVYQNNQSAASDTSTTTTAAVTEQGETEMPDLGIFTPVLSFVASGFKQALLMGIPGLITWQMLRATRRKRAYA